MSQRLTDSEAREAMLQEYSDAYKAANGMRPRWDLSHLRTLSLDDLFAEVQGLWADAEAEAVADLLPEGGEGWSYNGGTLPLASEIYG